MDTVESPLGEDGRAEELRAVKGRGDDCGVDDCERFVEEVLVGAVVGAVEVEGLNVEATLLDVDV